MFIHLIILYTIFFFIPSSTFADSNLESLDALHSQCERARSLSQYAKLDKYSNKLIALSIKKDNKREETYGYFYSGLAKLFMGEGEKAQKLYDKAEELSTKTNNDSVKALVMNARGIYHAIMQNNTFIAQQYFFKSLELAKKAKFEDLCHRVRGNLLTLSHSMGDSIAQHIATEVYQYGVKEKNYEQIAMGSYYIATYHYTHNNFAEAEKYINISIDTHKKYPYEDIASVYLLYAKVLIKSNKLAEAENMEKKAIALAHEYQQIPIEVDAYITYAEIENKKGNYQAAIDTIKKAIKHAEMVGVTSKKIDCNRLMADNYLAINNTTEALKCLKIANELLTEQTDINMERLSHEQKIMLDIEQKEMEAKLKQEQIHAQRNIMILLALVVVVLLVLLMVIFSSKRKREALYKNIVKQNSRSIAKQQELQQQIDFLYRENEQLQQMQQAKEPSAEPETASKKEAFTMSDDKMDYLYTELCRLMENERLYTEAQLTREKMAEQLGTNRTYLMKVIKEKTNMNYLQFVNSYRINEAIKILSDKDKVNYPLKQIWSDLGFSSPSTFYKLFQQAVGITPSTYRKQFLEVNNETEANDEEEDNVI